MIYSGWSLLPRLPSGLLVMLLESLSTELNEDSAMSARTPAGLVRGAGVGRTCGKKIEIFSKYLNNVG